MKNILFVIAGLASTFVSFIAISWAQDLLANFGIFGGVVLIIIVIPICLLSAGLIKWICTLTDKPLLIFWTFFIASMFLLDRAWENPESGSGFFNALAPNWGFVIATIIIVWTAINQANKIIKTGDGQFIE